jgi:CPA2 family monovalent cation:H+ antiporter-2
MMKTMEHVAVMLPGLGEPVPVKIDAASPAVNRSLADLNIRGKTGATILAITRIGEQGSKVVVPSGKESLRVGDIIALAGSQESVESAIELLTVSRRASERS